MTSATLLFLHIVLGFTAIALGPPAMLSRKAPGLHPRLGEGYHAAVLGVCVTAGAMAVLHWERSWAFLPVAIGSYGFALVGYLAAKLRFRGWLRVHVIGQGSSYIALVTALLVVNWQTLAGEPGRSAFWPWVIPTLLGSPLIAWAARRIRLAYHSGDSLVGETSSCACSSRSSSQCLPAPARPNNLSTT